MATHCQAPTHLELLVELVDEVAEEVEGVLLLPHVDRLAPQLELLPEDLRRVVLEPTLQEVAKHTLDLGENAGEVRGEG